MSIWTDDAGCGDSCGPVDLWEWTHRAKLLESLGGDLGEGAFQQPKLLQLQAVLADNPICVDCDEDLQLVRAAAAPLRDQIVAYAKAGVKHNRAQGGVRPAPDCMAVVCTIHDMLSSRLSWDVTADLVAGVNTPEPLDTPWPEMGPRPPWKIPALGEYTSSVATWAPTLAALLRSARGGYSLAHDPAPDQQAQGAGGGGFALILLGGGLLYALTRRRR